MDKIESPFKFKVNDMVWYLSNNKVAFGCVVDVHYKSSLSEDFLNYRVKLTTHTAAFQGEEKKQSELFHTREELIEHLTTAKEIQ